MPKYNVRASEEAFVEIQAAHQLGNWQQQRTIELDAEVIRASLQNRKHFLIWDARSNSIILSNHQDMARFDGQQWVPMLDTKIHHVDRHVAILNELRALARHAVYCIDMGDSRGPEVCLGRPPLPIFQYNRPPYDRTAVLWPLIDFHTLGNQRFLDLNAPDTQPFATKIPKVVWRGALSGSARLDGERKNTIQAMRQIMRSNDRDLEQAVDSLMQFPRFKVIKQAQCSVSVDAGFVMPDKWTKWANHPVLAGLCRDRMTSQEMRRYKYLLCLEGNDLATSFFWSMNSNSVVFKHEYPWECFCDVHFRPWRHYVPVAADVADIEDKVAWCEDRPDVCAAIIDQARTTVQLLARQDLRKRAMQTVVARYEDAFRHGNHPDLLTARHMASAATKPSSSSQSTPIWQKIKRALTKRQ